MLELTNQPSRSVKVEAMAYKESGKKIHESVCSFKAGIDERIHLGIKSSYEQVVTAFVSGLRSGTVHYTPRGQTLNSEKTRPYASKRGCMRF